MPILNDGLPEPAISESIVVTLSNPTNTVLGARTTALVRLADNDLPLPLELELASQPVNGLQIHGTGHVPTLSSQFAPRVIDWLLAHQKP